MVALVIFAFFQFNSRLTAQPELMAWGNITGIRVDGQLMEFETSFRVVENDWRSVNGTAKERQKTKYDREGSSQIVNTAISGISFSEMIDYCGRGCAVVKVKTTAEKDTLLEGVFFCVGLPQEYYSTAKIKFKNPSPLRRSEISLPEITPANNLKPLKVTCRGFNIQSPERQLDVMFSSSASVFMRKETEGVQIYIELLGNRIKKGQELQRTFTLKAGGKIDNSPVEIIMDVTNPGRKFAGLGGNFRLQNLKTDPHVIRYCLDNLRIAWGRVEMPWNFWHPDENIDPVKEALSGKLNPRVHSAMEMARRLDSIGMPVIVSDWSAPAWAILGDPRDAFRLRSKGIYGYRLNPEKTEKIYKSLGDYLEFLKNNYGVEAEAFSFNESDLGINVRHTGREHAEFIKGFGAHLASLGLSTKILLGDNSDASTFDFIIPAMNDPETHKYINAVSFHSWRGCTDDILNKWAEASVKMNLPLIVAEGSTDAAAWNYPEIFSEQSFALHEISLYIRICSVCQPLSILQWQLTADYSVLLGEGIFGTKGPLKPTQRFWNLKQLASTPENAFSIPLKCNKKGINCAAFANLSRGEYAVHIVNNGAECQAIVKGIPDDIGLLEMYVTDDELKMQKTNELKVVDGKVEFRLHPAGFTTLLGKR